MPSLFLFLLKFLRKSGMTTLLKINILVSGSVTVLSIVSIVFYVLYLPSPVVTLEKQLDASIKIAVLNGCGREGLAAMFARRLRSEGFDVVNGLGGNADSFNFHVSVVVDRKGDFNKAQTVGKKLGISEILDQRSDNPYLIEHVVVILGRDWDTLQLINEEDKD